MVNNIPVNGWPQLKSLDKVQPILNRLDKIEDWKRTVKEETYTGTEITIENALALPARALKTTVNAIQDLHGYDKPWVGGAYKNKFDLANIDTSYFSVNNRTITNTQTDTVNKFELYVQTMNNGSIVDRVGDMIIESTGRKSLSFTLSGTFTHLRFKHNGYSEDLIIALMPWTATGDYTISFDVVGYNPSTAGGLVLSNIQLESGSTATSFAPYSNICPISGRTAVAVDDVGKNLYNNEVGTSSGSSITYTKNADGTIKATGTASANSYYNMTDVVFPAGTYAFNGCPSGGADNKYKISLFNATTQQTIGEGDTGSGNTFTANGTDEYRLFIRVNSGYAFPTGGLIFKPMVRLASITDDTYEPYAHSSATIQLGTTVYGAEINWDTGVATVTDALTTFDGSNDETINTYSARNGFQFSSGFNGMVAGDFVSGKCNQAPIATAVTQHAVRLFDNTALWLYAQDDLNITTVANLRTYLSSNPLQIKYELATPTTIQLTPEELELLAGHNVVTLNDGTMELKALTGANWS